MHAPIIYMTTDKEKIWDLSKPNEKDLFDDTLDENYDFESNFDSYVSKSDWWEIDTTNNEAWHRGQWDIEETIKSVMMEAMGYTKPLTSVTPGVLAFTITEQDAKAHLDRYRAAIVELTKPLTMPQANIPLFQQMSDISNVQYQIEQMDDSDVKCINMDIGEVDSLESLVYTDVVAEQEEKTFYVYTSIQGDYHY